MMSTNVLKCNPASISFSPDSNVPNVSCAETKHALHVASRHLLDQLEPVVIPTETVYGLAASALSASAVSTIYTTKGRPSDNPLIIHISSREMLSTLHHPEFSVPWTYRALMKSFWPGPLTLLFPANRAVIPSSVTANLPTVAIRMPSHPIARALIAIANTPLAAPSANSSGKPSPTHAEHVRRDLDGRVSIILDGGPCTVGVESTVVDGLSEDGHIRVLRPGGVTVEELRRILEEEAPSPSDIPRVIVHGHDFRDQTMEAAPTTPGMKYRHYSPSVPVVLLRTTSARPVEIAPVPVPQYIATIMTNLAHLSRPPRIGLLLTSDSVLSSSLFPEDSSQWRRYSLGVKAEPSVIAQRLFDGLLSLERDSVDLILVEEIPLDHEGLAIMNRISKAAGETVWLAV